MSSQEPKSGDADAAREREQEPPIGQPEELHPNPEKRVRKAARESAKKGYPYEVPRPKAAGPTPE